MRIGIMGSGNVGGTLGRAWSRAGHEMRHGGRTSSPDGSVGSHQDVADWAEVIVFAVPGAATAGIASGIAPALAGKPVIDASNRMAGPALNSLTEIGAAAPKARLHRAFSTIGWEVMADPTFGLDRADLFHCGDEADREVVAGLIEDVGFRPVWLGGPEEADVVDGLTRVWFALAVRRGLGRHLAFRMLGA